MKLIIITQSVVNNTHSYNLESFPAMMDDFPPPLLYDKILVLFDILPRTELLTHLWSAASVLTF